MHNYQIRNWKTKSCCQRSNRCNTDNGFKNVSWKWFTTWIVTHNKAKNKKSDLKLSGAQISKIIKSGGFLGSLLSKLTGPLAKAAIPLAKNVLTPLGITAAASITDAGIQKKIHGSGTTTLTISNEEMNYIMKIVQALEDSNSLLKGVTKTIKNEIKQQTWGFLSILLGTLGASLLGNLLAEKAIVRACSRNKKEKEL